VDNVLVKIADPVFVGCFIAGNYDCACKVVPKTSPEECVGVVCLRDGMPGIVEYSELDRDLAQRRDEKTNTLLFNGANIVVHLFSIDFLKRISKTSLPYHIARKKYHM